MAIENQYIQTSLMVALSLFRGKEVYKSEVDIIRKCDACLRIMMHAYVCLRLPMYDSICLCMSMCVCVCACACVPCA